MSLAALKRLDLFVALHHYLGLLPLEGLHETSSVYVPLSEFAGEVTRFVIVLIEWLVLMLTAFGLNNYSITIPRYVDLRVFFT